MSGLMYPAYQKFYATICSLERFDKENNFFDNIASMDNFFSEYRSTTLVMQKSLSGTKFEDLYKAKTKGIWDKFFNDQRVKTIHIHPFELIKTIEISIYMPYGDMKIFEEKFTVENDVPIITLKKQLKDFFSNFYDREIFFSANYSFTERDSGEELWDKLMAGIETLGNFIEEMFQAIGDNCPLCNKLRAEIKKLSIEKYPKDFFLVNDYVYYSQEDKFEKASRLAMTFPGRRRKPLNNFINSSTFKSPFFKRCNTIFEKFVCINVIMKTTNIMPVLMIIYTDETFEMDVFQTDIKTTIYRKINEKANMVLDGNIMEVFFMNTYLFCEDTVEKIERTSKERSVISHKEVLAFMKVDRKMNEEEYVFEGEKLSDMEYITNQIVHGKKHKLEIGEINMTPIKKAFLSLR